MTIVVGVPSYGRSSDLSNTSDDQVPFPAPVMSAPFLVVPIYVLVPCGYAIVGEALTISIQLRSTSCPCCGCICDCAWNSSESALIMRMCVPFALPPHVAVHGGRDDLILSAKLIRIAPETSSF
jgi:hypothetical protein